MVSPPRDTAMLPLPARFAELILTFAPLFVHRSWRHAQLLLIGAILTPGRRTVSSILRIMGRAHERRFVNAHRILNRAAWCPRAGSRILLGLLIEVFAAHGPVNLGLDDTIERRWGRRIQARGIGCRALGDLAPAGFGDITAPTSPNETPLPPASLLDLRLLPRRMKGQSRDQSSAGDGKPTQYDRPISTTRTVEKHWSDGSLTRNRLTLRSPQRQNEERTSGRPVWG